MKMLNKLIIVLQAQLKIFQLKKSINIFYSTNGMYPITYTPTSLSESNSKLIL